MSTNDPQTPGETPSWNQPGGSGPTDPPSGGAYQGPPTEPRGSNAIAIVLLVLGVIELLLVCCCGPGAIGGAAAIVFSILAITKRNGGNEASAKKFQTFAIISLVVGLVLALIYFSFGLSQIDFDSIQNQLDQIENTGTLPEE